MQREKITGPASFIGVEGDSIISFGSGQPDLPPPKEIFRNLENPRLFQYGLIQGETKLRQALAKEYPGAREENFVITNGASEALDLIMRVLAKEPGSKKVLLPKPYYYSYPYILKFAGLTPVFTELKEGRIELEDLYKKIKTVKAVLINSPSNPTGRIEAIPTLKEIERITKKLGVWVISDEVYKDLIYERENYILKGRHVITINSFSKTYNMCGLRVGYLWTPDKEFIQKIVDIKVHTSMNTNLIGQEMAFRAMRAPRSYVEEQVKVWKSRRDLIYGELIKLGFKLWQPEGAFYVFPEIKNSNRVVNELFYKHKVIVYDGAWFGSPGRIRLSYALDAAKMKEGLNRISKYLRGKESWLK